ncbi:MAG: BMP family ABC transporter substrate-binding protein [Actinomycetales bacterium]|nr:MAG: BMP family ABC transporter substrate-binding protein [Actinomycetales bacterium]
MKKVLTIVAVASAMALVVGSGSAVNAADKELNIQMVSKGFQHQFWQAVRTGSEQAGKALNAKITFVGPESETMVDKQLEQLQAAIDSKPDAIGYASLDPKAPLALLKKAKTAGIPVYMFDAAAGDPKDATQNEASLGATSDIAMGIARTDGVAASALAADKMAALIGGKGKVFVISHSQVNATGIQRRDGFVNQMKKKYPKITVLPVQYADGDHLKSADTVKAVIAANKDLKGVFATNEGGAIGAVDAFKELKLTKGKIKLIGFDSGAAQINAIKSGLMNGAITQDPIGIGYKTVAALVGKVRNGTAPKNFIDTGFYYYNSKNLTDPKIAAVLYQ